MTKSKKIKLNQLASSNQCLINIKDKKKDNEDLTLFPIFTQDELTKKNKSFDFTEQSRTNVRKRIKNKIKDKIQNITIIKNFSNRKGSSDSEDNKKRNAKYISFAPNSSFLLIFDTLLIFLSFFSFSFL